MKILTVMLLALTSALSGCYVVPLATVMDDPQYRKTVKMMAVGYGSINAYERYSEGQKRLLAMRASKLDAYRAMAEQVYGIRVSGNTQIAAMVIQNDNFRVSIDAYVRGARVTNIVQMADGNYETSIELEFDESLARAFGAQAPGRAVGAATYPRSAVGPGSGYGASYYYAE